MTISEEEKNNYSFSKILINLMKGIVYREDDVNIWNYLEDNESQVSEHFKIIGLRLIVDKSRGYAYLKQIIFNQEEEQLPRLIRKQPLSRQVSILIVVLRQIVIEKENSGSDDRIIVSFDDIADKYRAFYPNSNDDEKKFFTNLKSYLKKVIDLDFIRELKSEEDNYEIKPIIVSFVDMDWLNNFKDRLTEELRENSIDISDENEDLE
jgi:hypothetical protein